MPMTKLILEIPEQRDLDLLIPLLERLRIRFSSFKTTTSQPDEIDEAMRIVRLGCEMSSFGDALEFQADVRRDRLQPFRDSAIRFQ